MLKMYSIQGFNHILSQQVHIHKYVLSEASHMHFTPKKLINFETMQLKRLTSLLHRTHKYNIKDIVTISTKTDVCKITNKSNTLWKSQIDHNIINRC